LSALTSRAKLRDVDNQRRLFVIALALILVAATARAQPTTRSTPIKPAATIASVMNAQLRLLESQLVPAAEAMPEAKYAFVPEQHGFDGVRTFALQLKHVATSNIIFYSAIVGEPLPPGVTIVGATNGPDEIRTKAEILSYLKASFALGHRAIATPTARGAANRLAKSPIPGMDTPLALASWSCAHAWDHYGQIVAYLRLNDIVPPASAGQPPANPRGH
jgi:hypothetical protein